MWKRKIQETPFPNFKIKGTKTTQSSSFQSGRNASSLHWWIQVYHHLLRWLLFIWGYVLPQKVKWRVRCIQQYKAWAKHQLGTTLNADNLIKEESSCQINRRLIWQTTELNIKHTCQIHCNKRFQKTIVNGAEAMQHHAGLSNCFWIYAVKAKLHTYNITPITWADYKTPTELWSSIKLNISHLQVFSCQGWVHIFKKRRHKLKPKSWEMIFVVYELGSKG